jgi:hypothetical protein
VSDNPDSGLAEDEEMTSHLLALLYPDEGDASVASESEYEDASELSDLRSLLGHFREMPVEDPPVAISNKLLAMAAQEAPAEKKAAGISIFQRISDFLLPAVYHPGLASAATLVLVAGLGATLYVNGKSQVAEPTVATQAAAPQTEQGMGVATLEAPMPAAAEAPAEATDDAPADTANMVGGLAEREVAAGEGDLGLANEADRNFDKKAKKEAYDKSSQFKAGAKRDRSLDGLMTGSGKGGGGMGSSVGTNSTRRKPSSARPAPKPKVATPRKSFDSNSQLNVLRGSKNTKSKPATTAGKGKGPAPKKPKAPQKKPSLADESKPLNKSQPSPEPVQAPSADPAPPPPTPTTKPRRAQDKSPEPPQGRAGDDDDDDDAEGAESEEVRKDKPAESKVNPAAAAAALHKQAITAAKKNQCSKVKSIGQKIRKLSSAYYDRTFLSDKKLTACLAPDVKK